jgi:hypothetical protein
MARRLPQGHLLARRWHWKAAILSAASRGLLFFVVNLGAGLDAAGSAMLAEFTLRAVTAGFYGALTQTFASLQPAWAATLAASLLLPVTAHSVEFALHYVRGTPALAASIGASAAFTVISTQFNLYAMRRGVLIVGAGRLSLAGDLKRLPLVVAGFCAGGVTAAARSAAAFAAGCASLLASARSGGR